MKPLMKLAFCLSEVEAELVSGPNVGLNVPPVGSATRIASAKTGPEGPGATLLGLATGATVGVTGGLGVQAVASTATMASAVTSRCRPLRERAMVAVQSVWATWGSGYGRSIRARQRCRGRADDGFRVR